MMAGETKVEEKRRKVQRISPPEPKVRQARIRQTPKGSRGEAGHWSEED